MTSIRHTVEVGDDSRSIAVLADAGAAPGVLWLGGFRSEMTGSKAEAVAAAGRAAGRAVVRFDYSGHGASGGRFVDGTIGRWLAEATAVFDRFTDGPTILVGSSMGGWIALLLARALAARGALDRVKGLVLVAPAPDFTEALMLPAFPPAMRTALERDGRVALPSAYSDDPTVITRGFVEEARDHLLLGGPIAIGRPVHVLQGMRDPDVPWRHALALVEALGHDDVVLTLVKDGDHRLSRPEDVARLLAAIDEMAA